MWSVHKSISPAVPPEKSRSTNPGWCLRATRERDRGAFPHSTAPEKNQKPTVSHKQAQERGKKIIKSADEINDARFGFNKKNKMEKNPPKKEKRGWSEREKEA